MPELLHHLIRDAAASLPNATALTERHVTVSYQALWARVQAVAGGLQALGLAPGDRIAIQLPKTIDNVVFMFASAAAGCVLLPINPALKPHQVMHILNDSGARLLLTNAQRAEPLIDTLDRCPSLEHLVLSDGNAIQGLAGLTTHQASDIHADPVRSEASAGDLAAIFYTSGSTGLPKGVMLSHANLATGAASVNAYLHTRGDDILLAPLPFSFDYGFSQLTTAFTAGAQVVLMEYLLPPFIPRAIAQHRVTMLAGVPVMWNQLARVEWPEAARATLRCICNSGGALPVSTTRRLRERLPGTRIYLMYGLTEAFRSTYLDPSLVDAHPDAIGRPIPHAEIHVVRPDGSECATDEPGELVHLGPLVAQGYWNAPDATARTFRAWQGRPAVWSGDQVIRDAQGLLHFVGRQDGMIKTSGYRVSPTEIESEALQMDGVRNAVALGMPDAELGQAIVLFVQGACDREQLKCHLHRQLPSFMQPAHIRFVDKLPLTPNGKPDHAALRGLLESAA